MEHCITGSNFFQKVSKASQLRQISVTIIPKAPKHHNEYVMTEYMEVCYKPQTM